MRSVAYDLCPYERPVRPHAPATVKFVPWIFYSTIAIVSILLVLNFVRTARSNARGVQVELASTALKREAARLVGELAAAARRKDIADDIRDWLEMSPSAQELLLLLNEEFARNRVVVRSLGFSRAEGQPLVNYTIIFALNDKKESLKAVLDTADLISARFGALGYKTIGVPVSIQDSPGTWKIGQTLSVPLRNRPRAVP